MSPKEQALKDVELLKASRGWLHLVSVMEREIVAAAKQVGVKPQRAEFIAGAIYSAEQLVTLPDRVIAQLTNDVLLDAANKAVADAKLDRKKRTKRDDPPPD